MPVCVCLCVCVCVYFFIRILFDLIYSSLCSAWVQERNVRPLKPPTIAVFCRNIESKVSSSSSFSSLLSSILFNLYCLFFFKKKKLKTNISFSQPDLQQALTMACTTFCFVCPDKECSLCFVDQPSLDKHVSQLHPSEFVFL